MTELLYDLLETENLLQENDKTYSFQCNSQESILILNTPAIEEISIAPGKRKQPYSLLEDENYEPLTFPYVLPTGKFGYRVEKDKKLSPVKYFNQRLLNLRQLFASNTESVLYALSVSQHLKVNSQVNIALKKVCSGQITAGMLRNNFSEIINGD